MDVVSIIRPIVDLAVQHSQEAALAMHRAKSNEEVFKHGEKLHGLLVQLRLVCNEFPDLEADVAEQLKKLTEPLPGCEHCAQRSATHSVLP